MANSESVEIIFVLNAFLSALFLVLSLLYAQKFYQWQKLSFKVQDLSHKLLNGCDHPIPVILSARMKVENSTYFCARHLRRIARLWSVVYTLELCLYLLSMPSLGVCGTQVCIRQVPVIFAIFFYAWPMQLIIFVDQDFWFIYTINIFTKLSILSAFHVLEFTIDRRYWMSMVFFVAIEFTVSYSQYIIYRLKIRVFQVRELLSRVVGKYQEKVLEVPEENNVFVSQISSDSSSYYNDGEQA